MKHATGAQALAAPIVIHETTLEALSGNFIVYEIWQDSALIYLGVCKFASLYALPDAANNSEFMKRSKQPFTVRVLATGTRHDCVNYRQALAKQLPEPPVCNKLGAIGRHAAVMCIEDNRIFRTQEEAAKAYGVTQPTISNHLRGCHGYGNVNGKTFRRVHI